MLGCFIEDVKFDHPVNLVSTRFSAVKLTFFSGNINLKINILKIIIC